MVHQHLQLSLTDGGSGHAAGDVTNIAPDGSTVQGGAIQILQSQ
jgi:hypothetical protein